MCYDFNLADVAQLVEQRFRKARVGGSIPLIGFEFVIARDKSWVEGSIPPAGFNF